MDKSEKQVEIVSKKALENASKLLFINSFL